MAASGSAAQPFFTPESSAHAATSQLLSVAEIPGKGRALVACQPLRAGQIVLEDSPILLYSAFPMKNDTDAAAAASSSGFDGGGALVGERKYCSHCFRVLQTAPGGCLFPCLSCPHAVFCSPRCRAAALDSSHAPWLCQALLLLRNSPPVQALDQERQVQIRFLVSAYNLAQISPSKFRVLLSLDGGAGAGSDSSAATYLHSLIASLSPPPPRSVPDFSPTLTEALLVKDKVNAFGLMEPFSPDSERSVRAYGIYPNASFFNHDCLPNACRFDYVDSSIDGNTGMTIRMIHNVPQGQEVCLSYFPVIVRFPERQKRLREDYGFTCECDRCKVEFNWSDDDDDDDDGEEEEEEEELQEDDAMEEDLDEGRVENDMGEVDFPHAYFFLKFMCKRKKCWGTLAPLPPSDGTTPSDITECSVCGRFEEWS